MKAISLLKAGTFSLFIAMSSNAVNANELAQIVVQDSNVKYAQCMETAPTLKANDNSQNTLTNFYAKEAHELSCRKQFGGPVLTYSFVDH